MQSPTTIVWVHPELFQQRVCQLDPSIDLVSVYKLVDRLRSKSKQGLFSLTTWEDCCDEVLDLEPAFARHLFTRYKLMESWSGQTSQLTSSTTVAQKGGISHFGVVALMAQFLFVQNYCKSPTVTAAELKLQVESIHPAGKGKTGINGDPISHSHAPASPRMSSKLQSWTTTMKLRHSSGEDHCSYVVKNFKSLLRLVVSDLTEEPSFDRGTLTKLEVQNFAFLFGACYEQVSSQPTTATHCCTRYCSSIFTLFIDNVMSMCVVIHK